jgi:hypothetical protein
VSCDGNPVVALLLVDDVLPEPDPEAQLAHGRHSRRVALVAQRERARRRLVDARELALEQARYLVQDDREAGDRVAVLVDDRPVRRCAHGCATAVIRSTEVPLPPESEHMTFVLLRTSGVGFEA